LNKWFLQFAIFALVLTGTLFNASAFADTIVVTNSSDAGPGTLRQVIADSVPGDTITFALTDTNVIALTNGALVITNVLTIVSSNGTVAIDAGGLSRVFEITGSNIVTLDSLIITNGNVPDNGGGILVDAGAMLTLTNCIVAGNFADAGGGIFLSANSTVVIDNSSFSANSATNNGGAIADDTGGTLTISGSIFTGNSALQGGAIFNNFGTNTLSNCSFSDNAAGDDGGAIANFDSVLTATGITVSNNFAAAGGAIFNQNENAILTLNNSTLSANFATNYGGGILNTNGAIATLNDSTISTNSCPRDQGGGIDNWATLTINRCTVVNNSPGGGVVNVSGIIVCNNSTIVGNYALFDGGGFYSSPGTNTLNNCTIYGNAARRRGGGFYTDMFSICAVTNTIITSNSAGTVGADVFGDIPDANNFTNGDPVLAPLSDYGGPTQTMPPLFGSPAINAGLNSVTNILATDQRGYPRRAGAHVDIGAVELQPSIVLNADDDGPGSLRAVASSVFGLIVFTNTLSGETIHLTSGQLTLSNSVEIDASSLASGIVIDAGGTSRVLEITSSNSVTLDFLTITNGNVSDNGGGILVDDSATLILANCTVSGNSAGAGGGVYLSTNSAVGINNSAFFANSATNNGGAISGDTNSTLTVNNSAFSANSANSGGAIFNNFGSVVVNSCTFLNNASIADTGGGICNAGTLLINTCTLDGNSPGGGIAQISGMLTVNNSTVSHNTALQSGGGFAISGGASLLNNSTVFGNSATNGGGMAIGDGVTNLLNNCTITGNSADTGGGLYQAADSISLLTNTIVAGNSATSATDVFGPIDGANNLTNGNPLLAPFGNYGGPTQTLPPLAGSAAINAGIDSAASLLTDQRGYPRQSGTHVDIGAVEAQIAPANQRPVLHLSRQPVGSLTFSFTNVPNADFTALSSTNVALPWNQWNVLGPALQISGGFYQFSAPTPTNSRALFFQVVSP
jgi:parallel beta-helix repeat protein/predicted outer membrane repeat protein